MPFEDDPEGVPDDTVLIRVLRDPMWWHPRENPLRPSSLAFIDATYETSCFVVAEADFVALSERFVGCKFARVTARSAREAGFAVCRDPEGADGLPGHVVFTMPTTTNRKKYTKAAKQLADTGTMFDPPMRH